MKLRLINVRLPIDAPEQELPRRIAHKLKVDPGDLQNWQILRKSLDARSRQEMVFVFTLTAEVPEDGKIEQRVAFDQDIEPYAPEVFDDPPAGERPLEQRPVIVGTGPAGLLAGYYLALRGYQPLMIDRGQPVKARVPQIRAFDQQHAAHDPENNYLFGEGGAGCFSDGKLTCRMTGADVDWVLDSFIACGGRESIRYEHRPHLGSNRLPMLCRNYRRKIEALGGEYRFGCRLEGLQIENGQLVGISTSSGVIPTRHLILAIGHSARDTYQMLYETGLPMVQRAFQLGLRIEQPQENVNKWKYGDERAIDLLGAADYSIIAKGAPDLYTFCMCAGGYVIPSVSEPGQFCTNGMSNSRHDTRFANSGLMVTLDPKFFGSEHPLAGVELQRRYEAVAYEIGERDYLCPIQWAKHFLSQTNLWGERHYPSSYQRGAISCDLRQVLPPQVLKGLEQGLPIMDKKMRGAFLKKATLVGPEMRGSAPLRIDRDRMTREVPGVHGIYPVGEGAGYAGGIVSAAVDGLRSAREIVRQFAPLTGTSTHS